MTYPATEASLSSEGERMITERQLEILQHATAWPMAYRNHFVTEDGSDDYDDCEALVSAGLMRSGHRDWVPGTIYWVTEAGKDALAEHDSTEASQ